VQFALPEAVERLRAAPSEALFLLNAADPADLFGGEFSSAVGEAREFGAEGEPDAPLFRFARLPSTHLALWRGQPILLFEDNGDRLTVAPDIPPQVLQQALAAYLGRPVTPRRVVVSTWNGAPVQGSQGQAILKALGFQNLPSGMEWRGAL